jgi:hypothetical protein
VIQLYRWWVKNIRWERSHGYHLMAIWYYVAGLMVALITLACVLAAITFFLAFPVIAFPVAVIVVGITAPFFLITRQK